MRGIGSRVTAALALAAVAIVGGAAQVPAPRPRITGIDHVAIRVSDAAAARGFYARVLGLSGPAPVSGGQQRYQVGSRQSILVDVDLPAGEDERLRTLAFATPDLDALAERLRAKGHAVTPRAGSPRSFAVLDPDQHLLTFVERAWPPPSPSGPAADGPISSRVLHAGLSIRDEAAANAFYRDLLGFGEIWRGGRTDAATDWVNMRVPDGTDYLEYMLVTSPPDRRQRGVLHHVALLVPDIQAAWEAAAARTPAADRARLEAPRVGRNGRWQLNLYDGDGTRTELMEPFTVR